MIIPNSTNFRELHSYILNELKKAGVKHRMKKSSCKHDQGLKTIFGAPLTILPQCEVTCCGSNLNIPIIVRDMCNILIQEAHIEGLFRKAGSQSRQREIKKTLESTGTIDTANATSIDIACILKRLLRSLPEPLIPSDVQDVLLMCRVGGASPDMMFHALLLLPILHVHLLHYILELLNRIASRHSENSMNATNLAIVMVPSIMPLPSAASPLRLQHHVEIVKYLIDNSCLIGALPTQYVCATQVSTQTTDGVNIQTPPKKKKKRRSGSFSKVFQGICKMVSGSNGIVAPQPLSEAASTETQSATSKAIATEPPRTPVVCGSAVKRKMDSFNGLSAKRKNEIRNQLPSKELIITPMKMSNKRLKHQRENMIPKTQTYIVNDYTDDPTMSDDELTKDYVKISKIEYEEIKKRVSAIENRLSREFDEIDKPLRQVQNVYERTLDQTTNLNSDHWTRRLSREINIRQNGRVIRSPSARKIGTVRRRSRENLHIPENKDVFKSIGLDTEFYPYVGLTRRTSSADFKVNKMDYDASDIMELKRKIRRCSYESPAAKNSVKVVNNNLTSVKKNNLDIALSYKNIGERSWDYKGVTPNKLPTKSTFKTYNF